MMKSALELALERAEAIKIDPEILKEKETEKRGKIFIASALADETLVIEPFLKNDGGNQLILTKGMVAVMLSNIVLPMKADDLRRLTRIKELFCQLNSNTEPLLDEVYSLCSKYLQQKEQVIKQLEDYFEPVLRQKEQQMAEQTGKYQALTISNYPEAQQAYRDQMELFDHQYREALNSAKDQMASIFA